MKKILITLALLLITISAGAEINDSSSHLYPFLNIGAGARAIAMGEAFTAIADDSSATYWNASGLALVKSSQVSLSYDKRFMDTSYQYVSLAVPVGLGSIGANLFYMDFGAFELREQSGALIDGVAHAYEITGTLAYGVEVAPNVLVGGAVKIVNQEIYDNVEIGYGLDVGGMYFNEIFSVGLNVQNFGLSGEYELPMGIRGGIGVKAINTDEHGLLLSADTKFIFGDMLYANFGAEYRYTQMLYIRTGYKLKTVNDGLEKLSGISGGIGLKIGQLAVDYAVVPFGELGVTHNVTAGFVFGLPEKTSVPKVSEKEPVKKEKGYIYYFSDGMEYAKQKKYKEAIVAFNKALKLNNKQSIVWKNLGNVYYNLGQKKNAIKCFETAVKLNPKDEKLSKWLKTFQK